MRARHVFLLGILISVTVSAAVPVSLIEAVKAGDAQAVRAILKQRADVNASEADGMTALHWAVRANDMDTMQLLLRSGANAKAANRYGVTPLSLAATNGNAAMIEALIKSGADPNAALPEGETVLMTAARTRCSWRKRQRQRKVAGRNGSDVCRCGKQRCGCESARRSGR